MLVVSDSSPLIVLTNIECIDVLPGLFNQVVMPPAVAAELASPKRPPAVLALIAMPPCWLVTRTPQAVERIPRLHPGEAEAISLAQELKADLLLVDDRRAYQAALARNVPVVGTVRVLERAAEAGLLNLRDVFDRLKRQADFWISHELLDQRLELYLSRHNP